MMKLQRLVGLVVCGWLSGTGTVHADAVTDWHGIAVQALVAAWPLLVPFSSRSWILPIVQAAVHDAVQAIDRRLQTLPRRASLEPRARRPPPPPARRMMSSSPSVPDQGRLA